MRLEISAADRRTPARTDLKRVRQILVNLLRNAIQHSPREEAVGVAMRVDDTTLWFSISDRGPGIDVERQKHLFDAYVAGFLMEGLRDAGHTVEVASDASYARPVPTAIWLSPFGSRCWSSGCVRSRVAAELGSGWAHRSLPRVAGSRAHVRQTDR